MKQEKHRNKEVKPHGVNVVCPFVFTGNAPRKGKQTPLNFNNPLSTLPRGYK